MTVAGSSVQFLAKNSTIPILVIKDDRFRERYIDKSYRFGVCIDGSEQSKMALRTVLSMMQKQDKCVCIVVKENKLDVNKVVEAIDSLAKEHGVDRVEKVILDHPSETTVYQIIKQYLFAASVFSDDGY